MRTEHGFTLIELLITVAVVVILLALAIPNFRGLMDRNAATTTANNLHASILLARSEAIKREQRVIVEKKSSWSSGWRVFAENGGNTTFNEGTDELIDDHNADASDVTITGNGEATDSISYNSRGRIITSSTGGMGSGDNFSITKGECSYNVTFNPIGRPQVSKGSCS